MSRRTGGPDPAEQNRATLKQLVKLEQNKSCADCKRNKHPRWASWNLGIFICIRCSGIHRGMGTHISRVKSVDLDSWTDEQLQSMVRWGNGRANKYWEHKLAEAHVPNEAKIENFIRTKYDTKRWVMDGPIPDPASLDDDDDDVPLSIVQEKARSSSGVGAGPAVNNRNGSAALPPPANPRGQQIDLFGDDISPAPALARPNTTEPTTARAVASKPPSVPAKQNRPGESLLGLDFFGSAQSAAPARASSIGPNTSGSTGRTDLKQSILSLYASKPAAPPAQPAQAASNIDMFGGMTSPPLSSPSLASNSSALGGLGDAFSSLSFGGSTQSQTKSVPFAGLSSPTTHSRQASIPVKPAPLSGGGFFDSKPSLKPVPPMTTTTPSTRKASFGGDFGDFTSAALPTPTTKSPPPSTSKMGDLFDLSAPAPAPTPQARAPAAAAAATAAKPPPISAQGFSAFNLTQIAQVSASKAAPVQPPALPTTSNLNSSDAWGSTDAWATPDEPQSSAPPPPPPKSTTISTQFSNPTFTSPAQPSMTAIDNGWRDPEHAHQTTSSFDNTPRQAGNKTTTSAGGFSVQQDEEFGGWSHASPVATPAAPKQGGISGNSDDLFGNVWG